MSTEQDHHGVDVIRTISREAGEPVVPEWDAGSASPDWRECEYRCFKDVTGQLFGGLWEGDPGSLRMSPYPYDEVCVMLEGRVALVDEDGGRREFTAGEAFFVPRSFSGTWETIEPSRKVFIGFDSDQA